MSEQIHSSTTFAQSLKTYGDITYLGAELIKLWNNNCLKIIYFFVEVLHIYEIRLEKKIEKKITLERLRFTHITLHFGLS